MQEAGMKRQKANDLEKLKQKIQKGETRIFDMKLDKKISNESIKVESEKLKTIDKAQ